MHTATQVSPSAALWQLSKGCATTYRPRGAGVLRVTSGRVWATLNPSAHSPAPRRNPQEDAGDFFIMPGTALSLRAGQDVVLESWPAGNAAESTLAWEPVASSAATRWQQAVVSPLADLGQGLALVARSLGRLLGGLAGYTEYLVAGRGKVQTCMESNRP